MSDKSVPSTATKPMLKRDAKRKQKPKTLPPFNVVLLDDDDHSYEYVIEMLKAVFGYDEQKCFILAQKVDEHGRVILLTTHKELAELKCEQVTAYGTDWRVATCVGSMTAVVEAAA